MTTVRQIGRYQIPLLSPLVIITQGDGTYKVILPYNVEVIFNEEEKQQYDQACSEHATTMQVYGMVKGLGRVGM